MTSTRQLLALFNDGRELTLEDICTEFDVSERHARRMLNALRESGVPIEEKREKRRKIFSIPEAHQRPGACEVNLTEEEIFALSVAAGASRAALAPTPIGHPLESAFESLLSALGSNVRSFDMEHSGVQFHFGQAPSVPIEPEMFRMLLRALEEHQSVRIDYLTASTGRFSRSRKVDPLGIAVRGGSWMLVAHCHRRKRPTDFSIAGIHKIELCDPDAEEAYFLYPDRFDIEMHYRDRFSALSGDEVHEVRLRVEPDRVPYFQRKEYHPTQQIEELENGDVVVSYEVAGLEEIRSFVQSWGTGVTVLAPKKLARVIAGEARKVAKRYSKG